MNTYILIVFPFFYTFFFAQGMQNHKREYEEDKEIQKDQSTCKKRKKCEQRHLTRDELFEQQRQSATLFFAICFGHAQEVQQALENGANPNFKNHMHTRSPLVMAIAGPDNFKISTLLLHGAIVGEAEMATIAKQGTVHQILDFAQYGGIFNDPETQHKMLIGAIKRAWRLREKFTQSYLREQSFDVLLWLLLRMPLSQEAALKLKAVYEEIKFVKPDGGTISLRQRLGPLLIALIFHDNETAITCIQEYICKKELHENIKRILNKALIFAAANDNTDILTLLLEHFKGILTEAHLIEAFIAAALRGHLRAFKMLIESNLVAEKLTDALESALLTAAAQMHENVVRYILDLDLSRSLNLTILPVIARIGLIKRQPLSRERKSMYKHLLNVLTNQGFMRSTQMIIERGTPAQEQEAESFPILNLPPEVIVLILSFLRLEPYRNIGR